VSINIESRQLPQKVFISYAHESEKFSNKVLEFSDFLRSNGVDAEIDQYEESPPEGWPKWMMRQIQSAEFVLICCSELFFKRANDFSGEDDGLGVKWETSLMLQQLYALNTNNTKYIPVIFDSSDFNNIPLPLQPYTYYDVSVEDKKAKLINRLLGFSQSKRPPLGEGIDTEKEKPPLEPKEKKSMFLSSIIDIDLWNKATWAGMAFVIDPSLRSPPIACFMFDDEEAGNEIFHNLKADFGDVDEEEEIRLSFVESISEKSPLDYKVHFGSSVEVLFNRLKKSGVEPDSTLLMMVSRINEMNPPKDPSSLTMFKHAYSYFKHYYITNAFVRNGQLCPNMDNLIEKKSVNFRVKSEVVCNKHDEDIILFRKNSTFT
jgi:SEFIR domain